MLACAGQWRFASSKLKTIWAKQLDAEQQATAAPPGALAAAEQAPVDASGRAVLLKTAEELSDAFWKDSPQGRALLQEVSWQRDMANCCRR